MSKLARSSVLQTTIMFIVELARIKLELRFPYQRALLEMIARKKPVELRGDILAAELEEQFVGGVEAGLVFEKSERDLPRLVLTPSGGERAGGDVAERDLRARALRRKTGEIGRVPVLGIREQRLRDGFVMIS